jgi:hypothetical protein
VVTFFALTETTPMENSVTAGQIISPAINDSTIEINESIKPLVEPLQHRQMLIRNLMHPL